LASFDWRTGGNRRCEASLGARALPIGGLSPHVTIDRERQNEPGYPIG